jgi:AcrR family transcriptional regulator
MPRGSRIGTREEILATALDLFLAQGYEATSLREIAERLQITKAALYYHFPAKEQLVVELARQFLNDLADMLAKVRSERSRERRAGQVELLTAYLGLFIEHHKVVDLLSRNPAAQNHPDVGLRVRTLVEALTAELAGPDAMPEDKLRAACAIGAISSVAWQPSRDAEKARAVILGAALAVLDAEPMSERSPHGLHQRVAD